MSQKRETSEKPSKSAGKTADPKSRKAYGPPKVKAYGSIREITQGVGHTGPKDGAPGSHKTQA